MLCGKTRTALLNEEHLQPLDKAQWKHLCSYSYETLSWHGPSAFSVSVVPHGMHRSCNMHMRMHHRSQICSVLDLLGPAARRVFEAGGSHLHHPAFQLVNLWMICSLQGVAARPHSPHRPSDRHQAQSVVLPRRHCRCLHCHHHRCHCRHCRRPLHACNKSAPFAPRLRSRRVLCFDQGAATSHCSVWHPSCPFQPADDSGRNYVAGDAVHNAVRATRELGG